MLLHEFCLECNIDLLNYSENKFIETLRCRAVSSKICCQFVSAKIASKWKCSSKPWVDIHINAFAYEMLHTFFYHFNIKFYAWTRIYWIVQIIYSSRIIENKTLLNYSSLTNIVIFWNQNANCRLLYHEHKHERINFYSIRDCRQSQMQFFFQLNCLLNNIVLHSLWSKKLYPKIGVGDKASGSNLSGYRLFHTGSECKLSDESEPNR